MIVCYIRTGTLFQGGEIQIVDEIFRHKIPQQGRNHVRVAEKLLVAGIVRRAGIFHSGILLVLCREKTGWSIGAGQPRNPQGKGQPSRTRRQTRETRARLSVKHAAGQKMPLPHV